jgi:hypothetical protein
MPADYLSRNVLAISEDVSHLLTEQKNDPQLTLIREFLINGKIPNTIEGTKLVTQYGNRCFVEDDLLWIRFYDSQMSKSP